MIRHRLIPIVTPWTASICSMGLAFLLGWPADSAARPKRPGTGNHLCNCGCSYRANDGKFYFQNGHNISTNVSCAELTVSDSKCEVKTGGHIYTGVLMGCSGDGSGGGPPAIPAPPSTTRPMQPPAIPIPPPGTR